MINRRQEVCFRGGLLRKLQLFLHTIYAQKSAFMMHTHSWKFTLRLEYTTDSKTVGIIHGPTVLMVTETGHHRLHD